MKKATFQRGGVKVDRATRSGAPALVMAVAMAAAACTGGWTDSGLSEGDRCNPLDVHNECSSGLSCTGQGTNPNVPECPENYCCPIDSNGNINSTNALCQPGCAGGALAICNADKDPGACALALPDAGGD